MKMELDIMKQASVSCGKLKWFGRREDVGDSQKIKRYQ